MNIETTLWDSAEYLETEEDIQLYFEACVEESEGDTRLIAHAISVILRARSLNQLSQATGLSREETYRALSPDKQPSFSTLGKLAAALDLQLAAQAAIS